jgi:hypothetical protein
MGADEVFLGTRDLRLNPDLVSSDIGVFNAAIKAASPDREILALAEAIRRQAAERATNGAQAAEPTAVAEPAAVAVAQMPAPAPPPPYHPAVPVPPRRVSRPVAVVWQTGLGQK